MVKRITAALLITAMLLGLSGCGKNQDESVADAKPQTRSITISEDEFLDRLDDSIGMWEFAQSFFDDMFIYKSKLGTWCYKSVDYSLPMNNYDWSKLRHAGVIDGTEWEYYEGTELVSIKGIDISEYNKVTDWNLVKEDGVSFAFIRAGYRGYGTGKFKQDEDFIDNITGACSAGIDVGVYFVTQAISVAEAVEEADWVLDRIKEAGVTVSYPIALDLEDAASLDARTAMLSKSERTKIIRAFCERIKEAGYTPMLYSGIRWYLDEMELANLTEYCKWFAQYFNKPFFPYDFQIWQYTSSGKVNGIEGNVDLNLGMYDFSNPAVTKE